MNIQTKTRADATVVVATICLFWAVSLGGARERASGTRFDVRIPFAFIVGNHTMPAGRYRFEQILDSTSSPDILLVRSTKTHAYQAVTTTVLTSPDTHVSSRLLFQRYGDRTFLYEVWIGSKSIGLQLRPSVLQTQVARQQPSFDEVSLPFAEEIVANSARGVGVH